MAVPGGPLVIWRFSDGKRGHDSQSLGLVEALAERCPVHHLTVPVPARRPRSLGALRALREARRDRLPRPHLLVGAGRATGLALALARREHGARAVAIMRPGLPRAWFDLCLVPEHDGLRASARVLLTRGALNRVRAPAGDPPRERGLVLLGGPSRHHRWSTSGILAQVAAAVADRPPGRWSVATSRRTPPETARALAGERWPGVELHLFERVGADWLPRTLALSSPVWVSEDSVSMIYEALSAGAAVGVLEVPRRRRGRVVRGLEALQAEGLVTPFRAWREGTPLRPARPPLDEAGRCAEAILRRWFGTGGPGTPAPGHAGC